MKSNKELETARSKFIKAFNYLVGILRMKGLKRKVALGLALMTLIGGRASIRNTANTFELNYPNLLDRKTRRSMERLSRNNTQRNNRTRSNRRHIQPQTLLKEVASKYGNYWCSTHKKFEPGILTIALHDLTTGKSYLIAAIPYATRKMWESGMTSEFKTKIEMASEIIETLKNKFPIVRVVFDSWYWSERLVKGNVVSELKSNRRVLRVRCLEGELEVEGHLHVRDLPPGSYLADLTLGDKVITIKLLVGI